MKKVLLTLAAVVMAFAANAQFVIGGDLNIGSTSSYQTVGGDKYVRTGVPSNGFNDNNFEFSISPRVGYQFTDKVQAGLFLTYSYDVDIAKTATLGKPTELAQTDKDITTAFGFGLYGRYNFAQMGKFTVFGQLNLGMLFDNNKVSTHFENGAADVNVDVTKGTTLAATLVPGLNYAISDCISVDLYLNFIALNYVNYKEVAAGTNPEVAEVYNNFNLGANMDDIAISNGINGLAQAITVGLNWHIGASKAE